MARRAIADILISQAREMTIITMAGRMLARAASVPLPSQPGVYFKVKMHGRSRGGSLTSQVDDDAGQR